MRTGRPCLRLRAEAVKGKRARVWLRAIMALARHRDYRLTATVYTDVRVIDTFGASARLPEYDIGPEEGTEQARRTGTDDSSARVCQEQDQIQDQKTRRNTQSGSIRCGDVVVRNASASEAELGKNGVLGSVKPVSDPTSGARKDAASGGVDAPRVGLEPTTCRLTAGRSTN